MAGDIQLLRINYEVGWNCDWRCRYCYRFFDCPQPEKEEIFYRHSRFEQIKKHMAGVKHKVAVMAGKGGVGKTTVTASLALQLALEGYTVGILDVDFAGASIANFLHLPHTRLILGPNGIIPIPGPYGVKVISNSFFIDSEKAVTDFDDRKQELLEEFLADVDYGGLDFLLIDMPPGTGIEVISVLKLVPAIDGVLLVTLPSEVAQEVVLRVIGLCRKAGARLLGLVENMSSFTCPECGCASQMLARGGAAILSHACGVPVLASIPGDSRVSRGVDSRGGCFLQEQPPSPAAQACRELAGAVKSLVGITSLPEAGATAGGRSRSRQDKSLASTIPAGSPGAGHGERPPENLPQILELNYGSVCRYRCRDCADYFACSNPARERLAGQGQLVQRLRRSMALVRHKVAVLGGKGGVGKSTVAANLAVALSRLGKSSAILDADFHGPSIPKLLGVQGQRLHLDGSQIRPVSSPWGPGVISMAFLTERDEAVTWFQELKRSALEQFLGLVEFGDLDYLVIDLPAGTGSETVNCLRLLPDLDGAVVVTSPSYLAQAIGWKAIALLRAAGVPVLGVVENMSGAICPDCGTVYHVFASGETSLAARAGVPALASLPLEKGVALAGDAGEPVAASTDTAAGKIFASLAAEIVARVERNVS